VLPKLLVGYDQGAAYLRGEAEALRQAQEWELLESAQAKGVIRPTARLALVDPLTSAGIADLVQSVLTRYLGILADAAAELEAEYCHTAACSEQGWGWHHVQHAVVGGWLMDLGFAHAFNSNPRAQVDWCVLGFTGPTFPAIECGVRLQRSTAAVLGEFWAEDRSRVPQLPVNLEPHELDALAAVARAGEALAEEVPPRMAAKLRYLGLLRASSTGRLSPALPVFDLPTYEPLEARVVSWARVLYQTCREALPPDPGPRGEVLRLVFCRGLLTAAYAAAQRAGILPTNTRAVPQGWGLWMWLEPGPKRLLGRTGGIV
jgi:hypothetical protein